MQTIFIVVSVLLSCNFTLHFSIELLIYFHLYIYLLVLPQRHTFTVHWCENPVTLSLYLLCSPQKHVRTHTLIIIRHGFISNIFRCHSSISLGKKSLKTHGLTLNYTCTVVVVFVNYIIKMLIQNCTSCWSIYFSFLVFFYCYDLDMPCCEHSLPSVCEWVTERRKSKAQEMCCHVFLQCHASWLVLSLS